MSEWQPIHTAPSGKMVLLWLARPISTNDVNDVLGWCPESEVWVVTGWKDSSGWVSPWCDEGASDSFGHITVTQITIEPTHWMPIPHPPGK